MIITHIARDKNVTQDLKTMTQTKQTLGQGLKLWVDVAPAAVFMVSYNLGKRIFEDTAIYWATGIFILTTAFVVFWAYRTQKRIPPMLIVTFAFVTVFGAMTIYLQNPLFIYIKPTVINVVFSLTILLCFAFGFNVWKYLFQSIFQLPEKVWFMLGIRWALFFLFLAFTNEILWRHITDTIVPERARWFDNLVLTESFWVNFRFFGIFPLVFFFAVINISLVTGKESDPDEEIS